MQHGVYYYLCVGVLSTAIHIYRVNCTTIAVNGTVNCTKSFLVDAPCLVPDCADASTCFQKKMGSR